MSLTINGMISPENYFKSLKIGFSDRVNNAEKDG